MLEDSNKYLLAHLFMHDGMHMFVGGSATLAHPGKPLSMPLHNLPQCAANQVYLLKKLEFYLSIFLPGSHGGSDR